MCEDIKFWKWISSRTLALVTAAAVYHWPLEGDLEPVKIFDRHTNMSECKIINYRTSSDEKWMVLVGIFSQVRIIQNKPYDSNMGSLGVRLHLRDINSAVLCWEFHSG